MNYLSIELLSRYSLSTLIIALISFIINGIIRLTFKNKLSKFFKNYFALVLSVVLAVAIDIIFVEKKFIVTEKAIYSGIASGSISTLLFVIINKLKKGENITGNTLSLIVEGLIVGYVRQDKICSVANSITSIIEEIDVKMEKEKAERTIKEILQENLIEEVTILELDSIISIILGVITAEQ